MCKKLQKMDMKTLSCPKSLSFTVTTENQDFRGVHRVLGGLSVLFVFTYACVYMHAFVNDHVYAHVSICQRPR